MFGDHFYRPQRSCGQGIYFYTCLSFCSQGRGGLPQCMLGYHPPLPPRPGRPPQTRQTPPHPPGTRWTPTPPVTRQTAPGSRVQHTVYERPVSILLECILVWRSHSFYISTRTSVDLKVIVLPFCSRRAILVQVHVGHSWFEVIHRQGFPSN